MPETDLKIVELMKQYADQGLTFYQAKQELIKQGYQEEAIDQANDEYQYGSKPKPLDPATAIFAKDPKDTELVAKSILKDQKVEREDQAIADGLAGQYSVDLQSDIKYQNNFLFDIGMSWWTWIIIEIIISGVIVWFKLPQFLYGIVVIILIIVLAIKRS